MTTAKPYDALLLLSFGGPEQPDDVMPFLENVVRGRGVPRERLLGVAEHYYAFGGKSPINDQNRDLLAALQARLAELGIGLPVYWGNLHWHPMLDEAVRELSAEGHRRVLAVTTSAFGGYSSCKKYREAIAASVASSDVDGLQIDKVAAYFHHPGFIDAMVDRLQAVQSEVQQDAALLFTAHSVPTASAAGGPYVQQLEEACRLVAERIGRKAWRLVYQSRSGPPHVPWLEPDVCDAIQEAAEGGAPGVLLAPIGFISDHMEVQYDLDHEAREKAEELGLSFARAKTVGVHPAFVDGLIDMVVERLQPDRPRKRLGVLEARPDVCALDCCPPPRRPPARRPSA